METSAEVDERLRAVIAVKNKRIQELEDAVHAIKAACDIVLQRLPLIETSDKS